jgi:hypothetical protein
MRAVLQRWLASPWAPALCVALGVLLVTPALGVGFATDDHIHRVLSRSHTGIAGLPSRPLDLFVFSKGDPHDNQALMDEGVFPWWTLAQAKLAFMRPLASLSHALDHALWPDSAWLMQAHSLVWFGLSLVLLGLLYRRLFAGTWLAALALLLYAVDDARGPTVGWIANRNASIALTLALPVLLFHDRARREGYRSGLWLAPAFFALALLAGESALATTAYLAAYALYLDRGTRAQRLRSLVPYLVVVLAWRGVYSALGYGVLGSGVYLDPATSPRGFLAASLIRLPILLLSQLLAPWSDLAGIYPFLSVHAEAIAALLASVVLLCMGWLAWPLLRERALARFFALGMLLAALPVCSTFPADRLLTFVGLGGMGLVACLIDHLLGASVAALSPTRRRLSVGAGVLLVAVHVLLSPPALALRSRSMLSVERLVRRSDDSLPSDASVRDKTVVVVNSPGDPFFGYLQIARESRGQARPRHLRWLATGLTAVQLTRLDTHSLRVEPEGGFLQFTVDQMLRDAAHAFRAGERVRLSGVSFVIERLNAQGRPAAVRAEFERPLEDPTLLWYRWSGLGLVPYAPPRLGESVTLPAIDMISLLRDSERPSQSGLAAR